jgi:DNA-binding MarR family transcriptional regulator
MLVLWENKDQPVNDIAKRLFLQTNTVTPLLKRMEAQGIISRIKSASDERKVIISLTEKGEAMKLKAAAIPSRLAEGVQVPDLDLQQLHRVLYQIIDQLK